MTRPDTPYLTDQLIPYIGNKRKLLGLIRQAIHRTDISSGVFFDAFAGSGVVSRLAKTMGYRVVANDWEPYAEVINKACIALNHAPAFDSLGGIDAAFDALNKLPGERGYISTHYCPLDDENYDVTKERMFYTQENGRRIDAMREQMQRWRDAGSVSDEEFVVLLAPLVFQSAYCSNTSGVFKGFHRGWGGATKTAWYRIRSRLTLRPPLFFDNGVPNEVLRMDASEAAARVVCDLAYLDPPYNQHQYGSNYHLLNTVALWDKPAISPHISHSGPGDKAAIRTDWRNTRRSPYCYRSTALEAFEGLLAGLQAKCVLVSYSTDGIIPVDSLLRALAEYGKLSVVTRKYTRYRVSSQRPSPRPHTTEFVAVVDTRRTGDGDDVGNALGQISQGQNDGQVSIAFPS